MGKCFIIATKADVVNSPHIFLLVDVDIDMDTLSNT